MTIPAVDSTLHKVDPKTRLIFKIGFFVFSVAVIAVLIYAAIALTYTEETTEETNTLVLVHLLLNHGERTPEQQELYESNPYYNKSFYYPYGYGRLTKTGKLTEYQVGEELRTRYTDFLGDSYSINLVDPRTTNSDMTKVSVQLVLAALFLPNGDLVWNDTLSWQPTPYNYVENDTELEAYENCANFETLYNALLQEEEIQTSNSNYEAIYTYLANYTGTNVTSPADVRKLYFGMSLQEKFGLQLEDWTQSVYPDYLQEITLEYYNLITNTTNLRKYTSGFLLKKMLKDTNSKIDGTLSPSSRKLFVYSGNDINVVSLLKTLGVSINEIPSYGSYVSIEVHNIDGENVIKVLYDDGSDDGLSLLTLDGCSGDPCTVDAFSTLVAEYIPSDNDC